MFNNLIYQTLEVITVIFETFIVHQYINGFFDRCVKTMRVFFGYALFGIGLATLSLFCRIPIVLTSYTVIGVFALEFFFYRGNNIVKVFSVAFFAILMIFSDMICVGVISYLTGIDLQDTREYGLNRAFAIVIVKIVQILSVKILGTIVKWKFQQNDSVEVRGAIFLIISQAISIIISYNIFMSAYNTVGVLTIPVLLSISGIMYINIIVFWYFDKIKSAYDYKHDKELAEAKLDYQKKYYELLDEHQQETESLWHDMKKHMSAIRELYESNLKSDTEEYINILDSKINAIPKIARTSIPALNAILVEALHQAKKENIEVLLDIKITQELKINIFDLCILLGNIVENAINACRLLPNEIEPYIELKVLQNDSLLLIDIKNPFIPKHDEVSRKERKRGYGLKNVKKVIQKYGGDIETCELNNIYHVSVIIP